jgi:type II secretory pathway component PulK
LAAGRRGSVLIIVLWVALGLVSITLYFAGSMSLEMRAADNRVSGLATEQAIAGAERYLAYILANTQTNGVMPDPGSYQNEAVSIGDAHFWLIGRGDGTGPADQVNFGLVDEASKLNLNTASSNMLLCCLP